MADAAAAAVLRRAIDERVVPSAVVEAGGSAGPLWTEAFAASPAAIFDLASLTKPIATTTLMLGLIGSQRVALGDPLARHFPEWTGDDRQDVTVRDLLEHASGLAARLVDAPPEGRREFEHEICAMRLEYAPRSRSLYSDLDFILLGFLIADAGGAPLDAQFAALHLPVGGYLGYGVPDALRERAAPTQPLDEDLRRGRTLAGEVHDNYAAALGGVAGHAGLFGTVDAVGAFARLVLRAARGDRTVPAPLTPELVTMATRKSEVPGSSRALGWDTMLPTSSCGTAMSRAAFGHVGFTGTSLWIDPGRDRYFVLLSNRVNGGGTVEQMQAVRRAFHDALAQF
jgi:CubicO group peptidase (beta-lactamase class C family)